MTKKRQLVPLQEIIDRKWCYYCERDFDDLAVLVDHQKAKHFKCALCPRRLFTAGGLGVHMSQVHKQSLTKVNDALPHREDPNIEIFGMEGIPAELINSYNQKVTTEYFRLIENHRIATGNPPPGTVTGESSSKKPKLEPIADMKARVLELKKKKAAEKAARLAGGKQDLDTPMTGTEDMSLHPQFQPSSAGAHNPYQFGFEHPTYPHTFFGSEPTDYPQTYTLPYSYAGTPTATTAPYSWQPTPEPYNAAAFYGAPPPPAKESPVLEPRTLPPIPGLPQRPSFSMPNLNKEDMVHLHAGGKPMHPTAGTSGLRANNGHQLTASTAESQEAPSLMSGNLNALSESVDKVIKEAMEQANVKRGNEFNYEGSVSEDEEPTYDVDEPSQTTFNDEEITKKTILDMKLLSDRDFEPRLRQTARTGRGESQVQYPVEMPEPVEVPQHKVVARKAGKKNTEEDSATLVYSNNKVSPEEKMAKTKRGSFVRKKEKMKGMYWETKEETKVEIKKDIKKEETKEKTKEETKTVVGRPAGAPLPGVNALPGLG